MIFLYPAYIFSRIKQICRFKWIWCMQLSDSRTISLRKESPARETGFRCRASQSETNRLFLLCGLFRRGGFDRFCRSFRHRLGGRFRRGLFHRNFRGGFRRSRFRRSRFLCRGRGGSSLFRRSLDRGFRGRLDRNGGFRGRFRRSFDRGNDSSFYRLFVCIPSQIVLSCFL